MQSDADIYKIDEKCSRTGGFKYDLMMVIDSGLLFGPPCSYFRRSRAWLSRGTCLFKYRFKEVKSYNHRSIYRLHFLLRTA